MDSNNPDALTRLERTTARLEVVVEGLEKRQAHYDTYGERIVVLETLREQDVTTATKRATRLAQIWSTVTALCVAALTKTYDFWVAHHAH